MKNITLTIKDENKIFSTPFVSGMVWRKFLELKSKINSPDGSVTVEQLDEFSGLVVLAFGNQFTLDEFYEGTPHDKVMAAIDNLFAPSEEGNEGNGKK
ncbi:phage tail assembly chaperone G [Cytobacillus firmus]|uniref:phage tail assembly chaperone G n=1 Tax=Cytobacillus firmus TaxID=1399 RepID=UPI0036775A83